MRAIQVPATGGDTLFSDMNAAYEGLSDEMKRRIDSLTAVHDYMKAFGHQVPPDKQAEMREKYPVARHPVVINHPSPASRCSTSTVTSSITSRG